LHRFLRRAAALTAALTALSTPGRAQVVPEPGSELTIFLATYGPGDASWEKFGHNAIWIRDQNQPGGATTYNYGMFDFGAADFYPRFMRGDMLYKMGVFRGLADAEAAQYQQRNRSVWVQELALTPAQRIALRDFLERNWAQDSGAYRYDYFRDNCSTRLRDALDTALGGVMRSQLDSIPTGTTFRSHSLQLTASIPALYTGLVLGLGLPTDQPINAWEETFVPMRLMERLRDVRVDGQPIVAREWTVYESTRPPPPDRPPSRTLIYLLLGSALGAVLVFLGRRAGRRRLARLGWAVSVSFWGILTGVFGLVLSLLWLFTDHTAAYPNLNLLHTNPLGFLLAVAAPLAAGPGRKQYRVAKLAWPVAIALAAMSLTGLVLQIVPALRQMNGPIMALTLPIHCAVVLSLYFAVHGTPSPPEDVAASAAVRRAA
jgi:hypothetical protein